ncbi:MAG: prolyl oligopeptidase family serine peptidase [Vicinamibacteria bacterium]|nr:prolyl oligopeptidase family serine peptidase [Vicinamibacteria bacterium]
MRLVSLASAFTLLLYPVQASEAAEGRPLAVDDLFALKTVGAPVLSPDGAEVAYTVRSMDLKKDTSDSDIYLIPMAGGDAVRLTTSPKAETRPRFSPDGKWIAFLSSREGDKTQVFLLPRKGGEASRLTDMKGGVGSFAWSPDSKRLVLVASDPDPDQPDPKEEGAKSEEKKTPPPIVTRRLQFMRDTEGFLREIRTHLYTFDVEKKASAQITFGPYDDSQPAWSPDGTAIAFVSNRSAEPDSNHDTNIFLIAPRPGEMPRALTTNPSEDDEPAWSLDGKTIVYVAAGPVADMWYAPSHVSTVNVVTGEVKALTRDLDRNVRGPLFSGDGRSVLFVLEDGGNQHLARISSEGGVLERLVSGEREVGSFDTQNGRIAFLESQPTMPAEILTLDGATARRLTKTNEAVLKDITLAGVERFKAKSKDGAMVDGFLTRPFDSKPGVKAPTILRIHGGPASQYSTGFNFEWQLLAAQGYAVVAGNPRGSTGYGRDFSYALFAKWGEPDFDDVMAVVDQAIEMGVADPDRLGVGGWSYGGILTNHVISKTTRFKAATSGASISNILAGYGTDHYQYEYEVELGLPWKNPEAYLKISGPFLKADQIKTPTLFLCGESDMNVPLLNTEQMYQAVRRLGVPTELVVYPDQFHGIRVPSYQKDRYERYLKWYDTYLRPEKVAAAAAARTPEAKGLDGREFFPVEPPPEAKKRLDDNLAAATADLVKNPDEAQNIIWVGRRLAYLSRYQEAIDVFSRGVAKFPKDARLLRHRGHRYISTRQFDKAVIDLDRAAKLMAGKPDEGEPDGAPGRRPSPSATLKFNIHYHLGLAHYLKGDFAKALVAYRECMKYSTDNDDSLVATSDWLYMTLRRLGRKDEAEKVLEPIQEGMNVLDNAAYHQRLLMYKGLRQPEEVLGSDEQDPLQIATQGYGVGNFFLVNGEIERAKAIYRRVVGGTQWAAFGFIAAEADLARMK